MICEYANKSGFTVKSVCPLRLLFELEICDIKISKTHVKSDHGVCMSISKFHHVWSTSRSPIYVLLRRRGMEGFLSTFIYTFRYICKSSCQLIRGSCFTGEKGALTIHHKINVNYYFDLLLIIVQAHSIFFARPTPNILTSEKGKL